MFLNDNKGDVSAMGNFEDKLKMTYIDDKPFATTRNQNLYNDVTSPSYMGSFMSFSKLTMTLWGPF